MDGDACDRCGGELLDLDDPTNLEMMRVAHSGRRAARIGGAALVAAAVATPLVLSFGRRVDAGEPTLWLAIVAFTALFYGLTLPLVPRRMRRLEAAIRRPTAEEARARRLRRRRWLTSAPAIAVIGILAAHVVRLAIGASETELGLHLRPADLHDPARWYALLSHALVHVSWSHVLGNSLGLLLFGMAVDSRVGRGLAALLLAAGVLGGAIATSLLEPGDAALVGISGGVYGLVGASLVLMPTRPWPLYGTILLPAYLVLPAFVAGYAVFDAYVHPEIGWLAHVGGAITGALLALPMRWTAAPEAHERAERERTRRLERSTG